MAKAIVIDPGATKIQIAIRFVPDGISSEEITLAIRRKTHSEDGCHVTCREELPPPTLDCPPSPWATAASSRHAWWGGDRIDDCHQCDHGWYAVVLPTPSPRYYFLGCHHPDNGPVKVYTASALEGSMAGFTLDEDLQAAPPGYYVGELSIRRDRVSTHTIWLRETSAMALPGEAKARCY